MSNAQRLTGNMCTHIHPVSSLAAGSIKTHLTPQWLWNCLRKWQATIRLPLSTSQYLKLTNNFASSPNWL